MGQELHIAFSLPFIVWFVKAESQKCTSIMSENRKKARLSPRPLKPSLNSMTSQRTIKLRCEDTSCACNSRAFYIINSTILTYYMKKELKMSILYINQWMFLVMLSTNKNIKLLLLFPVSYCGHKKTNYEIYSLFCIR